MEHTQNYIQWIRSKVGHDKIILVFASGCIRNEKGEILLQRRADSEKWGFPGGAIELGETPQMAAVREVKEETGLDVEPGELIGVYTECDMKYPNGDEAQSICIAYELTVTGGELCCDRKETLELRYFPLLEIPELFCRQHQELLHDIRKRFGKVGKSNNYIIRPIEPKDNPQVESVIRTCLIEFGGNREGTAWCDPDLGRFSEVYARPGYAYWVVENEQGEILGGSGIGALTEEVCELQKMYLLPEARGIGVAPKLMKLCLEFAAQHYKKCYIETFGNMLAANRLYQKNGFRKLDKPFLQTEHFFCDVWYIKDL